MQVMPIVNFYRLSEAKNLWDVNWVDGTTF